MGRGKRQRIFRASEVQRSYRALLDSAKEGRLQILDADGDVFGVEPWDELEFVHRFRDYAAGVDQFRQVFRHHRSEPVASWAAMTPFPWIDTLDADEVAEFAEEIENLLFAAANRGELHELDGALHAWRATANTYRTPEILAAMNEIGEPEEVFAPTYYGFVAEEEVHESAGGAFAR